MVTPTVHAHLADAHTLLYIFDHLSLCAMVNVHDACYLLLPLSFSHCSSYHLHCCFKTLTSNTMVSDESRVEHFTRYHTIPQAQQGEETATRIRSFDGKPVGLARSGVCMVCMEDVWMTASVRNKR